jgi:hypothetical protein
MSISDRAIIDRLVLHGAGYLATVAAGRDPGTLDPFLAGLIDQAIRAVGGIQQAEAPTARQPGKAAERLGDHKTATLGMGVMRTKIAALLSNRPEGYKATELQQELKISGPTLYQHLKALNGFVKKDGLRFAAAHPGKIVNDVVLMVNAQTEALRQAHTRANAARHGEARAKPKVLTKGKAKTQKLIAFLGKHTGGDLTTAVMAKAGGFPDADSSGQVCTVIKELCKDGVLTQIKKGLYRVAHHQEQRAAA